MTTRTHNRWILLNCCLCLTAFALPVSAQFIPIPEGKSIPDLEAEEKAKEAAEAAKKAATAAEKKVAEETPSVADALKPLNAPEPKPEPAPVVEPKPAPVVKPTPAPLAQPTPAPVIEPPIIDTVVDALPTGPPSKTYVITRSEDLVEIPLRGVTLIPDKRKYLTDRKTSNDSIAARSGFGTAGGLKAPPNNASLNSKIKSEFIGKKLTLGGLEKLVKTIQEHYATNGRPLTHVFVPSQLMTDKVKIAVLEGRVSGVRNETAEESAERQQRGDDGFFAGWSRWYDKPYNPELVSQDINKRIGDAELQPGDTSRLLALANKSPWARLNRPEQHPFLSVTGRLSPKKGPTDKLLLGETEVVLQLDQKRPLRFFAGYDNTLTDLLDENRYFVGAVWYDAFGLNRDHQAAIQLFSAADSNNLFGVAGTYVIPWKNKQTTELLAAYVDTAADIQIAGLDSEVGGSNVTLGLRHYIPLSPLVEGGEVVKSDGISPTIDGERPFISTRRKTRQSFGIYHEAGIGIDYKSTDNDLTFGGATTISDTVDLTQFVAEYNARQTDPSGETNLGLEVFYNPGISGGNFEALRSGADDSYAYTRVLVEREQDLPYGFLGKARLGGQLSSSNLLSSEQYGLGGYNSVRGYSERVARGDNAFLFSLELQTPPMRPISSIFDTSFDDAFTFLVFFDYAAGSSIDEETLSDESQTLSSLGFGFRYDLGDHLKFRFDYGFPLNDLDTPPFDESANDGQAHLGFLWTF